VTTATQTRPKTRKTILATVARFAHVSVRDVEAAVKDPGSVTSDVLAVVREAAQEVGFDMAAARPRRKTARPPEDGLPRTRSGLRKLDPKPLVEQGRRQAGDALAEVLAAAAQVDKVTAPGTKATEAEFYRSAAAKEAWMAVLERASRMVDATDTEIAQLRPRRDGAMLSLFLLDGKRGVDQAAGLSPTTWYDMRRDALSPVDGVGTLTAEQRADLARWCGVKHVPDAEKVIARVAPKILILNGYREEAFAVQKGAALHLHGMLGVPEPEIRDVTGRSEDTFWQWRHQESERRKKLRRTEEAERGKAS
jgi:hypothetical protein